MLIVLEDYDIRYYCAWMTDTRHVRAKVKRELNRLDLVYGSIKLFICLECDVKFERLWDGRKNSILHLRCSCTGCGWVVVEHL